MTGLDYLGRSGLTLYGVGAQAMIEFIAASVAVEPPAARVSAYIPSPVSFETASDTSFNLLRHDYSFRKV